ncbi:metallophosphoesterase family protein [Paenibacillus allorhizosphaerae]|uniref:3',5'-cyclic adenosine monophosphate phosphodiesterase CpdA n=1 Tax=Paenibacillus allorhizosphaerae TaxID=2849866 RepID=A0ABN7TP87_9BACL|nr:metallophosphoesterase [Paenibacillus allorhizosphaerae]CAG7644321.1 3',5'-cyclic adenosine monophosphate phosphodiesterase CpdA [Paenibacillus allorhizosphaerae]
MKLVVMGDFHYPRMADGPEELREAREHFFSGMLKAFLEIDADYHVSLGDFTNEGVTEELEYVFDRIKSYGAERNFIHVLGNHDAYSIPKSDILAISGQQRYHKIETDEVVLVFLDTTKEMNRKDYGGEVDPEQTAWLDSVLQQSSDKPVFVFGHHPIPNTTKLSDKPMLHIHPEYDIWPLMEKKNGRGYYFCGHNHMNSIVQKDQWHLVQTAACLDIPAFRMIEIKGGKVSVETVHIQDQRLLELAAHIGQNMKHFKPKDGALGEDADLTLTVVHG